MKPYRPSSSLLACAPLELTINGVKVIFRYCPPGKFIMGSPDDEKGREKEIFELDETPRKVVIERGFWLSETPITQTLWKAATGCNPSYFRGMGARPVERVGWRDYRSLLKKLNRSAVAPPRMEFDFLSSAEWEYACRAGTSTPFNIGDKLTEYDANFDKNINETTPVRSYAPNAWGFYDLHGNVNECCCDWLGRKSRRVLRGGSWRSRLENCRSAFQESCGTVASDEVGFRLLLRSYE